MSLIIKQQLVDPKIIETRTSGDGNTKDRIAVHLTGNTSPTADAQMHADLQARGNDREASWHWQVDQHQAVQSFLHEIKCWHATDGKYGLGLNTSIAVEGCVNAGSNPIKMLKNMALLIQKIMEDENISQEFVLQHYDFSGKNCPNQLRSGEWGVSWKGFINLVKGGSMAVNPAVGRVTSEFGSRLHPITGRRDFHAGIDIANKVGTPVYAMYAGRKIIQGENVVSGRTGKHCVLLNNDGEAQLYGHLDSFVGNEGDWFNEGDLIGYMGATGNVTGPHLHFEVWRDGKNSTSYRDPRVDFRHHGITPGVGEPKIPDILSGLKFLPLRVDGDFSHRSITELERALAATGHYGGLIEEDHGRQAIFGPVLWTALQSYLKDHGYYKLELDGIANEGGATKLGLQEWLRDVGYYPEPYRLDGEMPNGGLSWKGLQQALNAGVMTNGRVYKASQTTTTTTTVPATTTTTKSLEDDPELTAIANKVVENLMSRSDELADKVVEAVFKRITR